MARQAAGPQRLRVTDCLTEPPTVIGTQQATKHPAFAIRPTLGGPPTALLGLPLLGLGILLVRPDLNIVWHHHPSHFWLVLAAAGVSMVRAIEMLA
jgi:hypothetical protein